MAIKNGQRKAALNAILLAYPNVEEITKLLPDVDPDQVLNFLTAAVGANADAQLTTVLGSMVAEATARVSDLNSLEASVQADIDFWTVV